jgi:hypothetical protein
MWLAASLAAPLAVGGWAFAGAAQGASAKPSMQVLPKPTGLRYAQTVEIKGHHLPRGSGSVAATICGLNNASGRAIAKPTADDCAGASEIGKLVVVKSWQSNGEFDTKYTLPKSGQKFGKNARFCNKTHHCALVVADANPNAPAYYIETKIQFVDQAPKTTTTKPRPATSTRSTPTTTTTAPAKRDGGAAVTAKAHGGTSTGASSGSMSFGASAGATVTLPTAGAPAVPVPALPAPSGNAVPAPVASSLDQVCTQLANAVKQADGDATALLAACTAIESGSGPQQLAAVLQSPSLLCVEGASAWQSNPEITDACNQAAAGISPATSQIGGLLGPVVSGP